jgi:hypothetical protein
MTSLANFYAGITIDIPRERDKRRKPPAFLQIQPSVRQLMNSSKYESFETV